MAINKTSINYSLYLVTDRNILQGRNFLSCITDALEGGVTLLQLREKNTESREFYEIALEIKKLCKKYQVPFIINDRADIMLAVDADGLHIGQQDIPLDIARRIIGPDKLLGYSVANVKEALYGEKFADYLGAGTVFPTGSKDDTGEPIGSSGLKAIKQAVSIPVVGIGGISTANLKEVKSSGVDGISVISAILDQEDIRRASRKLLDIWAG